MKKNEKGITLISLTITVIVLALLSALLVEASIKDNRAINAVREEKSIYYEEKEKTMNIIDRMTNGWEEEIL